MTSKKSEMKNLAHLADIVLEKQMEQLSAVARAAAALEREVRDLDQALAAMADQAGQAGAGFVPSMAEQMRNWQRWRRQKRAALTMKLAATKAEQEEIRSSARLAFGRVQALRRIAETL